jgi:hypothetical protein
MLDQQPGQAVSIDQNNPMLHPVQVFPRLLGEIGSGNEDSLVGALARQRADKGLKGRPSDLVLRCLAFGLNLDRIQPKRIFIDDPVYPPITGHGAVPAAVSHGQQQIDNKLLELRRLHCLNGGKQFGD